MRLMFKLSSGFGAPLGAYSEPPNPQAGFGEKWKRASKGGERKGREKGRSTPYKKFWLLL